MDAEDQETAQGTLREKLRTWRQKDPKEERKVRGWAGGRPELGVLNFGNLELEDSGIKYEED